MGEQQEEVVFVRALAEGGVDTAGWLFQAATEEKNYQRLLQAHGKATAVNNLPPSHPAHSYRGVWEQLSLRSWPDGLLLLVLNGAWLVVPRTGRKRVLELLHLPHAGVVKTQQAARQLYYWPGMSAAVEDTVKTCDKCIAAL